MSSQLKSLPRAVQASSPARSPIAPHTHSFFMPKTAAESSLCSTLWWQRRTSLRCHTIPFFIVAGRYCFTASPKNGVGTSGCAKPDDDDVYYPRGEGQRKTNTKNPIYEMDYSDRKPELHQTSRQTQQSQPNNRTNRIKYTDRRCLPLGD